VCNPVFGGIFQRYMLSPASGFIPEKGSMPLLNTDTKKATWYSSGV
jgi:hypothetical protein